MDKTTRSAIERATQKARHLLEDEFEAQLEGTFDILPDGRVAEQGGPHLTPRQVFEREVLVAAIERKRAAGHEARRRRRRLPPRRRLHAPQPLRGPQDARGPRPGPAVRQPWTGLHRVRRVRRHGARTPAAARTARATASTSRACSTSSPPRSRCSSIAGTRRASSGRGALAFEALLDNARTARSSTASGPTTRRSAGSTSTSTAPTSARRCATRARRRGTAASWPSATSSSRRATSSSS